MEPALDKIRLQACSPALKPPIDSLANEILQMIFSFLPLTEPVEFVYHTSKRTYRKTRPLQIFVLKQVSKHFQRAVYESPFWVEFPYLDFDELLNMKKNRKTKAEKIRINPLSICPNKAAH